MACLIPFESDCKSYSLFLMNNVQEKVIMFLYIETSISLTDSLISNFD